MFRIDTSQRTKKEEIMDDFELKGPELERTLKDLENINFLLGGNGITLDGLKKILQASPGKKTIRVMDVGCGNGDILRRVAKWGRQNGFSFQLIGIDANAHAIEIAKLASSDFPELSYRHLDIFSEEFKSLECDVLLCTLTLHHFDNQQIKKLLTRFYKQANFGIVINDLHRTRLAYGLFKLFCAGFVRNEIARQDGLTSILRGFKKEDVLQFSKNLPGQHQIKWKWAFRYQWIIQKETKTV
ncbi:methyltransferase domain-containing protein [Gramella sp. GC03-9]|uniref:Methyltransferase domain-containing protein n=1 Tax=Christiangramia oceanisediminis TaxID=2920386 RepID=A0A9X2KY37_9FLAO|nr:methyltransferase domain-containing protein [Gramella oceanisediminis]MCP9200419.1 methyltransferase domain-containing protein [Gramella oceanisediminis]